MEGLADIADTLTGHKGSDLLGPARTRLALAFFEPARRDMPAEEPFVPKKPCRKSAVLSALSRQLAATSRQQAAALPFVHPSLSEKRREALRRADAVVHRDDKRHDVARLRHELARHFGSLERAFAQMDEGRKGVLDVDELRKGCQQLGFDFDAEVYDRLDFRGHGALTLHDVTGPDHVRAGADPGPPDAQAARRWHAAEPFAGRAEADPRLAEFRTWCELQFGSLRKAFDKFDINGNRRLACSEFQDGCRSHGLAGDAHSWSQLFGLLDTNKDGLITYRQLAACVAAVPAGSPRLAARISRHPPPASPRSTLHHLSGKHYEPPVPVPRELDLQTEFNAVHMHTWACRMVQLQQDRKLWIRRNDRTREVLWRGVHYWGVHVVPGRAPDVDLWQLKRHAFDWWAEWAPEEARRKRAVPSVLQCLDHLLRDNQKRSFAEWARLGAAASVIRRQYKKVAEFRHRVWYVEAFYERVLLAWWQLVRDERRHRARAAEQERRADLERQIEVLRNKVAHAESQRAHLQRDELQVDAEILGHERRHKRATSHTEHVKYMDDFVNRMLHLNERARGSMPPSHYVVYPPVLKGSPEDLTAGGPVGPAHHDALVSCELRGLSEAPPAPHYPLAGVTAAVRD